MKKIKTLIKAHYRRQNTCANCWYKNSIVGDKTIECTAFKTAPFVHQAYICDKWKQK